MYTIGDLVKRFSISRSTLLYYDKIGLLVPSGRSAANYRQYTQADVDRMKQISIYKEAGLSLQAIAEVLESPKQQASTVLEQRLDQLNTEISDLRQQQQWILSLLDKDSLLRSTKTMNKAQWVEILRASSMDDEAMHNWHVAFEKNLPEAHTDFLQLLGIEAGEIAEIKQRSK